MKHKVLFERVLGNKGNAPGMSIPTELLDYLGANSGDTMVMCADYGKYGRFISIWSKNQKEGQNDNSGLDVGKKN